MPVDASGEDQKETPNDKNAFIKVINQSCGIVCQSYRVFCIYYYTFYKHKEKKYFSSYSSVYKDYRVVVS